MTAIDLADLHLVHRVLAGRLDEGDALERLGTRPAT